MQIILSQHIHQDKLPLLQKHGFNIREKDIRDTILDPDHVDTTSDHPRLIASKEFSTTHILRVVYRKEHDIIKAITIYPAKVGRYY